jgi:hypothetical protein
MTNPSWKITWLVDQKMLTDGLCFVWSIGICNEKSTKMIRIKESRDQGFKDSKSQIELG